MREEAARDGHAKTLIKVGASKKQVPEGVNLFAAHPDPHWARSSHREPPAEFDLYPFRFRQR